ncbi:MAG: Rho termination factor N-terminal domain-containing protein [Deltaproteobacteria bacterium]|nr:Rho termination factor N-terminal domain-containing protein [Deltaproteobacteria bacterium]
MTVKEIKKIAKERGINGARMLKADLIRAIQVKEGNSPCYETGIVACTQTRCCWWGDCQKQDRP